MVGNDQHHSTATEGVRNNGKGCVRDHSIGEVRVQCGEDIFILNFKEKSIFGSPLNHARKKRHDESNLERISFRIVFRLLKMSLCLCVFALLRVYRCRSLWLGFDFGSSSWWQYTTSYFTYFFANPLDL